MLLGFSAIDDGQARAHPQRQALGAGEVVLLPTVPVSHRSLPGGAAEVILVSAVPESLDLVPTIEEFR